MKIDHFVYTDSEVLVNAINNLKDTFNDKFALVLPFDEHCIRIISEYHNYVLPYRKAFRDPNNTQLTWEDRPFVYHILSGSTLSETDLKKVAQKVIPLDFKDYSALKTFLKIYRHLAHSGTRKENLEFRRHIQKIVETIFEHTGQDL